MGTYAYAVRLNYQFCYFNLWSTLPSLLGFLWYQTNRSFVSLSLLICILGPFLFIVLCTRQVIFAWYQVSSYCTNTHQYIFADDTLFFARASRAEVTNLLNLLHSYTATTSQSINYHKSHILFSKRTSVHWLLCVRYLPLVNIWVYQCYLDFRIRKLWLLWKIALGLKHSPRSKNYYHILVNLL